MTFEYALTNTAFDLRKAHSTDTGYDIAIASLVQADPLSHGVTRFVYDTGVILKPASGWYFELVPRSSFSKTGLIFANSVGVIDSTYRGTVKIVVFGRDAQILRNGEYWFQLIPRRLELLTGKQVSVEEILKEETERGADGFGSSGLN
jgi:dUTP pyrophosphatase